MRQDGVMLEGLHRLENFLVVRFIVALFLAPPALEILCQNSLLSTWCIENSTKSSSS